MTLSLVLQFPDLLSRILSVILAASYPLGCVLMN